MLFPRRSTTALDGVLVNTAGGVTGGDNFSVSATAAADTEFTLTTQAAERAYRAQPTEVGQITNRLLIEDGARMNWLPQETILFQGSDLNRRLDATLSGTARFLMCEPLVFGRAAMGECLTSARLCDRINVMRGAEPLFHDALLFDGDIAAHLARPNTAGGAGAIATVLYVASDAEAHLEPVRDLLEGDMGASLIRPELLFLRALAPDSFALRKVLIPVLSRLLGGPLPRPWMI